MLGTSAPVKPGMKLDSSAEVENTQVAETEQSFTFVPVLGPKASRRQRELVRSSAISHASRVSHPRRRKNMVRKRHEEICRICFTAMHAGKCPYDHDHASQRSSRILQAWKGNSDPFSSQSIVITPRVNEAIGFHQRFVFEAKFGLRPSAITAILMNYTQTDPLSFRHILLSDSCFGTTHIFHTMTLMAHFCEGLDRELLVLKGQSIEILRLATAKEQDLKGIRLLRSSIYHMFAAAAWTGDELGMLIHGAAFSKTTSGTDDRRYLATMFHMHSVRVLKLLLEATLTRRPLVQTQTEPIHTVPSTTSDDVDDNLDESVIEHPSSGFFTALREAWRIRKHHNRRLTTSAWLGLSSEADAISSLRSSRASNSSRTLVEQDPRSFHDRQMLAIVVYQYESLLAGELSFTIYLLNPGQNMTDILRIVVENGWQHGSRNVILFSCLVGALAESGVHETDVQSPRVQGPEMLGGWFCRRLVGLTGGWKWAEVWEVSEKFLPLEVVLEDGEEWFRRVRAAVNESGGLL